MAPRDPQDPRRVPAPAGEGARRSGAAADARRREAARIAALSATERALLALDLGDRYASWSKRGGDR